MRRLPRRVEGQEPHGYGAYIADSSIIRVRPLPPLPADHFLPCLLRCVCDHRPAALSAIDRLPEYDSMRQLILRVAFPLDRDGDTPQHFDHRDQRGRLL